MNLQGKNSTSGNDQGVKDNKKNPPCGIDLFLEIAEFRKCIVFLGSYRDFASV